MRLSELRRFSAAFSHPTSGAREQHEAVSAGMIDLFAAWPRRAVNPGSPQGRAVGGSVRAKR
jgi:hypothetical protein